MTDRRTDITIANAALNYTLRDQKAVYAYMLVRRRHSTAEDAAHDCASAHDDQSEQDVASRRQPERVPVQRRVTVVRPVSAVLGKLAKCRIDPVISCTDVTL